MRKQKRQRKTTMQRLAASILKWLRPAKRSLEKYKKQVILPRLRKNWEELKN